MSTTGLRYLALTTFVSLALAGCAASTVAEETAGTGSALRSSAPLSGDVAVGTVAKVTGDGVRLRREPTLEKSNVLGSLATGTLVKVVATSPTASGTANFYNVEVIETGKTGWVDGGYLTKDTAAAVASDTAADTDGAADTTAARTELGKRQGETCDPKNGRCCDAFDPGDAALSACQTAFDPRSGNAWGKACWDEAYAQSNFFTGWDRVLENAKTCCETHFGAVGDATGPARFRCVNTAIAEKKAAAGE